MADFKTFLPVAFVNIVWAACAHAQVSVTTIGLSEAAQCFEQAKSGFGAMGINDCDAALAKEGLTQRDEAATYVNRGVIYNRVGKLDQAIADFDQALSLDDVLAEAYLNRGNTRFLQKKYAAAEADYTSAINLQIFDLYAAYYNRGLTRQALKRPEEALEDFRKSADLNAGFAPALQKLSDMQSETALITDE